MTKITEVLENTMDDTYTKEYIKHFSKRMLKTRLFQGTFHEKRYVDYLNSYRDVVKIDSEETSFIQDIVAIKKKFNHQIFNAWIGITGPDTVGAPVGYNLWVVLPIDVFGLYWFKVKTVEFLHNEIRLKLEVVRPIKNEKSNSDLSEVEDSQPFDLMTTVQDLSNNFRSSLADIIKNYVTLSNIKETAIFLSLLIGTIIGGGVNIIKFLMEYLLQLMKETSRLVKVCTPIIISCLELIWKVIMGLFHFIIVLLYGKPKPQPTNRSYYDDPRWMTYGNQNSYNSRRALPYNSFGRSSVRIQAIDD